MHAAVCHAARADAHPAPTSAHVFDSTAFGCCSCARSAPQSLCVRRNAATSLLTVVSAIVVFQQPTVRVLYLVSDSVMITCVVCVKIKHCTTLSIILMIHGSVI